MRKRSVTFLSAVAVVIAAGCSQAATAWQTYRDRHAGYSISYPDGWRVDESHDYQALGPGKDIRGTAFLVQASIAAGTNLSEDSYLAVETLPSATHCTADLFLADADQDGPQRVKDANGMIWSVENGQDAGAGNFYDETVFAAVGTQPCIGIRYFIHSTNIGNYDPGTVKAFDQKALMATFDRMRRSFRISPP